MEQFIPVGIVVLAAACYSGLKIYDGALHRIGAKIVDRFTGRDDDKKQ